MTQINLGFPTAAAVRVFPTLRVLETGLEGVKNTTPGLSIVPWFQIVTTSTILPFYYGVIAQSRFCLTLFAWRRQSE